MSKRLINLSGIFLAPLMAGLQSFIKVVGSGTGLGKSYSCILALHIYLKELLQRGDERSVLAIYLAPQHNQIAFPEDVAKDLEQVGAAIIRVKPISPVALSNIESETNAYDAVSSLFFNGDGRTPNALFTGLKKAAKIIDAASQKSPSPTKFEQTLAFIQTGKYNLDAILGKLQQGAPLEEGYPMDPSARAEFYEQQKSYEEQKEKLQDRLKELASHFQNILLNSYKNQPFYEAINQNLSRPTLKEFRAVTASFYPFLHYQLSGEHHVLMGMTVAKLMTQHHVFSPMYVKKGNLLKWSVRTASAEALIDDTSDLLSKFREQLALADAAEARDLMPGCRKLLDAEVHLYLDESDSSKTTISDALHKNQEDRGIIQANGALAKEAGSVLYDPEQLPLLERIPDTDREAYRYLTRGEEDDALERQIGKDILRKIQDTIIEYVASTDWDRSGRDSALIKQDLNKDIRFLAQALLSAPYCTVEAGVERSVFEMTSAFGGEMFGFIGSRYLDRYVVTATPSSIRITEPEYLTQNQASIPLRNLFLLITLNWFIFLSLSRRPGGVVADEKLRAQVAEQVNSLLTSSDSETASHQVEALKKFIKSLSLKTEEGLLGVAKPFRPTSRARKDLTYHTACAFDSILNSSLLGGGMTSGVFSPKGVEANELLGETTEFFNQQRNQPIDMDYGYRKATTIFGLAQTDNQDYMIARDKSHVVFPIKYRREAAESYLTKLVCGSQRRVCCFLMSATGAYENSHIPAWSMQALRYLAASQDISFLTMSQEDYAITAAKQQERGSLKKASFRSLDDLPDNELIRLAHAARNEYLKALHQEGHEEGQSDMPKGTDYHLLTLSNRHKRLELNNILKGLDFIHNPVDYGEVEHRPRFGLALAQTQQKFLAIIRLLHREPRLDSSYSIERLLGSESNFGSSVGYGIYTLTTKPRSSKFESPQCFQRKTLVVCYASALDKALTKIFKQDVKNPNSPEYKLKELLGMNPRKPLADTSASDFNPMNYLLNHYHDCNVYLVSAYQSAARGVNFIVNKETPLLRPWLKKPGKNTNLSIFGEDQQQEKDFSPRDLDCLFMAAPPYYSELNPNLDGGKNSIAAQARYFAACNRYFHYLEWLARRYHQQPNMQVMNTDIDLISPIEDPDADEYFKQQHAISLFSVLQQGLGRIERTNSAQHQSVFLCEGVNEIIHHGIQAITQGQDDKRIEQLVGAMSVINATLVSKVLKGEIYLPRPTSDNTVTFSEASQHRFENLKREGFLKAIQRYRAAETHEQVDESVLLEIEFYEAFRSTRIWQEGYSSYFAALESVVNKMPKGLKRNYSRLLTMMFNTFERPLDEYLDLRGIPLDLEKRFAGKRHAKANPYCTEVDGKFIYPAPWFLPDLEGNYGEWVAQLAIKQLTPENSANKRLTRYNSELARKGYELADFFVQRGKQVVAVDAKHYRAHRAQWVSHKEDQEWTLHFNQKLQRYQERLVSLQEATQVKMVAINTAQTRQGQPLIKKIGVDCYLINSESDVEVIAAQLGSLLTAGGAQ